MRYVVTVFGCQMNKHDSIRLEEVLRAAGHTRVEQQDGAAGADMVVLLTCSVREKAEQKLRSEVGRLALLKRARPELLLVVAGCMAQQHGERMLRAMPALDLVVGPDNLPELPELIAEIELGGPPRARTVLDLEAPRFLTAPTLAARRPTAYVTTMKGCNERCSFCIVPSTRGPERYRPSGAIVAEVEQLLVGGVREVTLLGQTVNSYRDPSGRLPPAPESDSCDPNESEFAALLRLLAERLPELCRLRYESPHPRHLTRSLVAAHRDLGLLARHVHLPVQSGSDRILKRMIRRHTRADYLAGIGRLRAAQDVTVSTDIIVGFCGETEEDFEQTLSLIDEVGFAGVFGFKYSPRPSTPALKLQDDVPEGVKSERLSRLFELSERLLRDHLQSLVGSRQRVLVEGPSKSRSDNLSGRDERNEIVHIEGATGLPIVGQIVEVEIVEAYKHSLLGRLSAADRERARSAAASGAAKRSLPVVGAGNGGRC